MPIQRDSSASPVRAALFFSAYAAIFTLLLTGSRQATLLIASAVTLATFAVWPHSAAQPLHAAVLIALEPGAYTAQVSGPNANASGVALVEIYEVP